MNRFLLFSSTRFEMQLQMILERMYAPKGRVATVHETLVRSFIGVPSHVLG